MSRKVFLGLSGGVDSSVAAWLLKEQGYEVIGVYMKNWAKSLPGFDCPWREDLQDAQAVAAQLAVEFRVLDFRKQYRQLVVDYLIDEYRAGLTPNPDVACNQHIKFSLFLEAARREGAELIATGHYARSHNGELFTALDAGKDQSYFLYRVSASALRQTLFPLAELAKKEVREIAARQGLLTARKKDSTGICFVGDVGIKRFLQAFVKTQSGAIIDQRGQEIGRHDGAIFYTIGQRHGLGVGGGRPFYVTGKDMAENIVFVTSDRQDQRLWSKGLALGAVHWIGEEPSEGYQGWVQIRYRGEYALATISRIKGDSCIVKLAEPILAAAAGQSVVIYGPLDTAAANHRLVWGGGVIASRE